MKIIKVHPWPQNVYVCLLITKCTYSIIRSKHNLNCSIAEKSKVTSETQSKLLAVRSYRNQNIQYKVDISVPTGRNDSIEMNHTKARPKTTRANI